MTFKKPLQYILSMTYRQLISELNKIDPSRLDDTATVFEPYEDEYIALIEVKQTNEKCDVLDKGHTILVMKAWNLSHCQENY